MAWPDTVLAGETIRDAGAQRRRLNPYYGKGTGARLRLAPPGMLRPIFLAVPEQKNAKNRWHLDIQATTTMEAEVTRLAGLGATVLRQVDQGEDLFTVMTDVEGNEFCVEVSPAERAALRESST